MKRLAAVLATVWAFALLFVLFQYSQNGRYQFKQGDRERFIDTRTGTIYSPDTATYFKPYYYKEYGEQRSSFIRATKWGNPPLVVSAPAN